FIAPPSMPAAAGNRIEAGSNGKSFPGTGRAQMQHMGAKSDSPRHAPLCLPELMTAIGDTGRLRLSAIVAQIPPGVAIPPGYRALPQR
ncbi:hypothetical protein, partial [Stenotrophomonas maltophilia]|uniref:hypothetical protein n=1 Tax=Stenotrophomonas maltophilia TaxID=40324 RepID=UPI0019542C69